MRFQRIDPKSAKHFITQFKKKPKNILKRIFRKSLTKVTNQMTGRGQSGPRLGQTSSIFPQFILTPVRLPPSFEGVFVSWQLWLLIGSIRKSCHFKIICFWSIYIFRLEKSVLQKTSAYFRGNFVVFERRRAMDDPARARLRKLPPTQKYNNTIPLAHLGPTEIF